MVIIVNRLPGKIICGTVIVTAIGGSFRYGGFRVALADLEVGKKHPFGAELGFQ